MRYASKYFRVLSRESWRSVIFPQMYFAGETIDIAPLKSAPCLSNKRFNKMLIKSITKIMEKIVITIFEMYDESE